MKRSLGAKIVNTILTAKVPQNGCLAEKPLQRLIGFVLTVKGMVTVPDMEKVIKGLETCKSSDKTCSDCPYNGEVCTTSLCDDALILLKEQGSIIEQYRKADGFLAAHGWKWEGR